MTSTLGYSEPVPLDELPSDADSRDNDARLWVGNMDTRVTEFNMLKILQKYGALKRLDFLYNRVGPDKGKPRGYCFVTYTCKEDAERAKKALNGKVVLSKRLFVKEAHIQTEGPVKQEIKPASCSVSAEDKIKAIEAKLKSMEKSKEEFSIAQQNLPVVVRQRETPGAHRQNSDRVTSGRHSGHHPYKKAVDR